MKNRLILYLALILFPIKGFTKFGYDIKALSFSYGVTNNISNLYQHNLSVDYWRLKGGCTGSSFHGFGGDLNMYNKDNYALGIRFFKSLQTHPSTNTAIFHLGIHPTFFSHASKGGANLAPELGTTIPVMFGKVGIKLCFIYGYETPIVNPKSYLFNRHRLTLKLGINLSPSNSAFNW